MSEGLIDRYPFVAERYDEMLAAAATPRAHWRAFAERLNGLPPESLARRADFVREAVEADGVTYSLHTDSAGTSRPWELDMLPLVVEHQDWTTLAAGMVQRARLLDAMLADLYGPRTLLREGLLPPALVFGQQGYKWACHGVVPPSGRFLHLYAMDVGRSPDGHWWVMGDHTQAPVGAGYALQNRIVVGQAFPDAFRELQVQTLAGFFRNLQHYLARMAPTSGDSPLVVLLSGGPMSESYFEHAFLARYLGFPLVEGQDLTVRDDAVYLKTLRGLRRVHAIMRRLEDDYCDPLELRADSALGVPGLLGAIRAGQVLMANALGSGAVEGCALFGFLPAICERLLGEPLALPSVASWWCGEAPALEYVLDKLDDLVIKPAFANMRRASVFGHAVRGREREDLIAAIRAQPHAYVAQEWVRLSQAPVWTGRADMPLVPRSVGLRLLAAATTTADGYEVMPGGLARIAPHGGLEVIPMHRGGLSKDTWVRSDGPVQRSSMIKRRLGVMDLIVSGTEIPSRVGENLFWMGRHTERCELSARILRAAMKRMAAASDEAMDDDLAGLIAAARRIGALPAIPDDKTNAREPGDAGIVGAPIVEADERGPETLLLAAVSDLGQAGSVASNVRALAHNAAHVRERLSSDNWRLLNRLEHAFQPRPTTPDEALVTLDSVMMSCISLAGFAMDDMTRDEGWGFLLLGRHIERLAGLASVIAMVLDSRSRRSDEMLEWLLEVANTIVTYRARYRRTPELLPVMHLLVFDDTNPHSVSFQVGAILRYLRTSARELGHPLSTRLDTLDERLRRFDMTLLEAEDCEAGRHALARLLSDAEDIAYAVSDDVHRRFFIHTVAASRLRSVA
ncbi:MAG: circularly permuted type 2 ATP-grasp protein [Rhodocyclaceae bacterium]